jgi:Outer membrane protein beta-barrel domain
MLKRESVILALGLTLAAASDARAQMAWLDNVFVNVNLGVQINSNDFETTNIFTVYDEDATITSAQSLGTEPVFLDIHAGYRIRRNLAVGIGVSMYTSDSDVTATAQIPHPLFFDQFRTVTVTASGAEHRTISTNLMAVWFWPYTKQIDFAFSAGPSIMAVKQDVVTGVTIAPETGPSFTNPEVTDVIVTGETETVFGLNLGVDATYMINERYGAGFGIRYLWGSADLPGSGDSLTVGGFQILGGLRVRF